MSFVRGVLFPGLRLIVWAVIAVALCVLAFGGDKGVRADPLQPSVDDGQRTVQAAAADIASTIAVTGTVAADPAGSVRATAAGTVSRVYRRTGDRVTATTPLFDVRVPVESADTTTTGPDGTVTTTPGAARSRTATVQAGSAGTLATMTVLKDQDVSVGLEVATVSPGTLSVSAPLTQAQQFRLLTPPATASAQARGGPAPFTCGALSTAAAAATATTQDPYGGQQTQPSTAQVTCRVPDGATVFAGMSVDLTIDTGSVRQVLAVPVSAVLGTVSDGKVWVVGSDGAPAERAVRLGLTDGRQVQVLSGLAGGEQVLEFTPVPSDDEPATAGPSGAAYAVPTS